MVLVPRHRREVCPLARRVMLPTLRAQPVSTPLQSGLRFFPPPYPHRHRLALRPPYLSGERSDTGLPRSARVPWMREALPVRRWRHICGRRCRNISTWPLPFWAKPVSPFGLLDLTTFIGSSRALAMSSHPRSRPPWGSQSCTHSHEAHTTWLVRLHCPKSFIPSGCPGRMSW